MKMQYRKLMIEADQDLMPAYAYEGDAGLDLRSAVDVTVEAGGCEKIPTGVKAKIPDGCVGLVFPRSGLGSKGITLQNAVGVVDSGYRGEIMAAVWNTTGEPFKIERGDRICQMVVMPFCPCSIEAGNVEADTERGESGHGSSGVR